MERDDWFAIYDKNHQKEWKDFAKKPETFQEAVDFFDFVCANGEDPQWSLQYYGFGEHFTFWSGYGGFIDFNIDNGTAFGWWKLRDIIVESAQALWEDLQENKPHLFKWSVKDFLREDDGS